ncbi:MAG: hypothetical protein PHV63_03000 [Candidatus Daviesbacteria bacterium]|nr:hypothetical protein [Candidatus Daviesbacteria bacterium]
MRSKNKSILITIGLILLLIVISFVIFKYATKKDLSLADPRAKNITGQSTPVPLTPSYNPPQEVKYDSATDLKKELDSIDPQLLESDFE